MNYQKTLDYLFSRLPMYQRIGKAAYKADLSNTLELSSILNNPYKKYPSVVIAGTNGKGSTAHMIASVLQTAGYKTGLYTSPHYIDFRERIKVNGKMVDESFVVDFVKHYKDSFEEIGLSFFEMTFGMAMKYFEDEEIDIAIFECGMGGRLDSTNIVDRILSVITNIGLDHTQFLGDTIEKIAFEKAGIIQQDVAVIVGELQEETINVFQEVAESKSSPVALAEYKVHIEYIKDQIVDIYTALKGIEHRLQLDFPLLGEHQFSNLKTAIASIFNLKEQGFKISDDDIKQGIENVVGNTSFIGRWQQLNSSHLVYCDSGHNEDGILQIVQHLDKMDFNKLHFVFGMVNDKSRDKIISLLPKDANYYLAKPNIPRGLDANELNTSFKNKELNSTPFDSVKSAIKQAITNCENDDLVFIGGSIFVVGEALEYFQNI